MHGYNTQVWGKEHPAQVSRLILVLDFVLYKTNHLEYYKNQDVIFKKDPVEKLQRGHSKEKNEIDKMKETKMEKENPGGGIFNIFLFIRCVFCS